MRSTGSQLAALESEGYLVLSVAQISPLADGWRLRHDLASLARLCCDLQHFCLCSFSHSD